MDFLTAQNLVQNPSFEQYTSCPVGNSGIYLATPWDVPPGSITTPDYMNSCATGGAGCSSVDVPDNFLGSAPAASGNAYVSVVGGAYEFCPDCREYISSPLTSPLVAGTTYLIQMYVRPADFNKYVTNNQAIYLSSSPVSQPSNQPITGVIPQVECDTIISDTSKWTLVSDTFVATGGEQYITIGNFHDDANTLINTVNFPGGSCALVTNGSMYLIDSVYVGTPNFSSPPLAGIITDDSNFCAYTCIDFTDASVNNPTSWLWLFPGGNPSSSTDQNPSNICYDTAGTFEVTLIVANAAGADTILMPDFVSVNSIPAASVTQSNDTLYASSAAGYQWYTGGSAISGATNSFYIPTQEDFYSVLITDSNGCSAADTIFFSLAPQSNFSSPDTSICQKFCMNFFDESGNNPFSWEWSFPGGSPSFSTDQNPTQICYNNAGTYDVSLITTNSYGSDTLLLTNYVTVFTTPPFPVVTQTGYVLTSSPAGSYQWQLNAIDIPAATNQSYTVMQTGYYTVVISDSDGCKNSATLYVLISGIDDTNSGTGFSVYPNPSSGSFIIELLNEFAGDEVFIDVMNTLGQKVFSSSEKIGTSGVKKEIDLRGRDARCCVSTGVYFIEIKTENIFMKMKIIVAD